MTREDAIEVIKSECYVFNPLNFDSSTRINTALDMVIKALDQEPFEDAVSRQAVLDTLDKIRAEIKALNPEPTAYDVVDGNPIKDAVWETLTDVLQIIDKYKAETEGEE